VLLTPGLSVIIDAIKESRRIFQRMTSYAFTASPDAGRADVHDAGDSDLQLLSLTAGDDRDAGRCLNDGAILSHCL